MLLQLLPILAAVHVRGRGRRVGADAGGRRPATAQSARDVTLPLDTLEADGHASGEHSIIRSSSSSQRGARQSVSGNTSSFLLSFPSITTV